MNQVEIPAKYRSCTLQTFKPTSAAQRRALKSVSQFAQQPKGWVYLFGPPGVGKTHLLVGVGKVLAVCQKCAGDPQAVEDGLSYHLEDRKVAEEKVQSVMVRHLDPLLVNHLEFLALLKGAIGVRGGRYDELLEDVKTTPVLLLDDLGIERQTEFSMEVVTGIVMARYDAELPTMFTSNKGLGDLAVLYDDRIVSRIHGMCQPSGIVEVTGVDARLRSA